MQIILLWAEDEEDYESKIMHSISLKDYAELL